MPSLAFHLNCKAQLFGTLDIELTRGNFNLRSLGSRGYSLHLISAKPPSWRGSPLLINNYRHRDNLTIDESFRATVNQVLAYRRRIHKPQAIIKIWDLSSNHYSNSPYRLKMISPRKKSSRNRVPYNLWSTPASVNERVLTELSHRVGLRKDFARRQKSFHCAVGKNNGMHKMSLWIGDCIIRIYKIIKFYDACNKCIGCLILWI